jgi:hypothetical protein
MRNYIVASWNDADQYDYSGEMLGGSRHAGRSQKVHFNPDGSACVASYGDDQPKVSKVSIKDKILPQGKRLATLREQMIELEQSYRNGEMPITDYSLYRDVIVAKIERQEVLLKRAISTRPHRQETSDENDFSLEEMSYESCDEDVGDTGVAHSSWLDELSDENTFKSFLKRACKVMKVAVYYKHKVGSYINELKAV